MTAHPHVLMTTDAVGGIWTYAHQLGRGLTEAGLQVTLAVLGPKPCGQQQADVVDAGMHLVWLGGALDWSAEDEGEIVASAASLARLCVGLRPDVVHLNSPALAAFDTLSAPVLAACHSCVRTWWTAVNGDIRVPDDLAWRAALVKLGYDRASALVAPSYAFAEATKIAYGLNDALQVIANGRCPLPTRTVRSGAAVFTAGRLWDEGKDIATLDRAIGRSRLSTSAAGPLEGPSSHRITLQHVRALGRLSEIDLQAQLSCRPIFVSPSLYEPFGLAVLEAAQAGCPLVLSDIPTFRELWDGAAVFFPPRDDAALADALRELAADPARSTRIGDAARTHAARYSASAMTQATLRLYAKLSPAFAGGKAAA